MRWVDVVRAMRAKALLQRVDRARADVPKDHSESCDDEGGVGKFM